MFTVFARVVERQVDLTVSQDGSKMGEIYRTMLPDPLCAHTYVSGSCGIGGWTKCVR